MYTLLRDIIVEVKAYLHYETYFFKSNKQMKLITGHIFMSLTQDNQTNRDR